MTEGLLKKDEEGWGILEIFPLKTSEDFLMEMLTDIFENYWRSIVFGTLIQGAAWEVKAPNAPKKISLMDGYITVDFGSWHFHICIGHTKGVGAVNKTSKKLAAWRRCSRAELYRQINQEGVPSSWGLRLFNGKDEQQMTVFLPNPFLSDEMKRLKAPDWSRLELWDHLRSKYLNLPSDPKDRSGKRFRHG